MKKILAIAAAGALLASVVVPALARGHRGPDYSEMSADVALVKNSASATADTGLNTQGNLADVDRASVRGDVEVSGNNSLTTGNASADATAVVVANTHVTCCEQPCQSDCGRRRGDNNCPCEGHYDIAAVDNGAGATAFTSGNLQGNEAEVADASVGGGRGDSCGRGGCGHHDGEGEIEVSGDNTLTTGGATSDADAWVVVNSHIGR